MVPSLIRPPLPPAPTLPSCACALRPSKINPTKSTIGGFRGGAEGAAPHFFLCFQNVLRFCFEKRFMKCSLILSSETLTLLYFASRIRPQCSMLYILKSEVSNRRGGSGLGDSAPSFWVLWIHPWIHPMKLWGSHGIELKLWARLFDSWLTLTQGSTLTEALRFLV